MNHKSHQYDNDEAQIQAIVLQNTTGGKLLAGPIAPGDTIPLGRCGENLAIKVVFDVSKLIESYGQGTFAIIAQRSGDDAPYPCEFTVSGTNVIWVITAADVDMPGEYGSCEIRYYSNDVLVKSRTWKTWADFSLGDSSASPPEASQGWVDQVLEAGLSAKASAASAASSAEAAIASQQSASASEGDAAHSASVAVGAHDAAESAKRIAESAKEAAEAAQKAAAKSESAAKLAEQNAKASESAAGSATASAWNASSAAQTAQRNAEAAQSAAEQSATEAGNANAGAVTAQGKAEDAQRGAEDAKTKAEASKAASANSESAAKLSEQNAKASEDAAKASETASAGSASAAAHSATAAQSAQSGAEAAQSAAAQSAQQAAESAAVYDNVVTDVTQLKADLADINGLILCEVSGKSIIIDRDIYHAKIDNDSAIVNTINRLDYTTIPTLANSYNSAHTITHEENGIKIVRSKLDSPAVTTVDYSYTAEFTGDLWFSCDANGKNIKDVAVNVKNTRNQDSEMLYGKGRVYCKISVIAGDEIAIRFYTCLNNTDTGNTIAYKNVMIQYGTLTDFVPYQKMTKTVSLPKNATDYSTNTAANGKYRATVPFVNIAPDYDSSILPVNNDTVSGIYVEGMDVKTYNQTFQNVNGIGLSSNGTLSIYLDGGGRDELAAYLRTHDVTITYTSIHTGTVNDSDHLAPSMVVSCDDNVQITGYAKPEIKKKIELVCMGDSITGMFGHSTGYPEMISMKHPEINVHNVGFSGSSVIDHSDENYKPFSFNRIINAIVSGDWTMQDDHVENVTSAYYSEHLTKLKNIDFNSVDFVTVLYGTNDWGYNKDIEDFKNVYSESIKMLLEAYPHIRVVVICPYWRSISAGKDSNIDTNANGVYLYEFADAIENVVSAAYNLPCANLYRTLGANVITNRYYTQDGTHPTFRTRNIIADRIISLISC